MRSIDVPVERPVRLRREGEGVENTYTDLLMRWVSLLVQLKSSN
jgi:hypothetical protein